MNLMRISQEYVQKHTPEDNSNIESVHSSLKINFAHPCPDLGPNMVKMNTQDHKLR